MKRVPGTAVWNEEQGVLLPLTPVTLYLGGSNPNYPNYSPVPSLQSSQMLDSIMEKFNFLKERIIYSVCIDIPLCIIVHIYL